MTSLCSVNPPLGCAFAAPFGKACPELAEGGAEQTRSG